MTEEEEDILYWFFCGDTMFAGLFKTYTICSHGVVYMNNIPESTVLSLVEKKAIQPIGLSAKEWKVQIALGVGENTRFTFTLC